MSQRIKIKAVPRGEIDSEQLALIYWLQAKRVLRERREQEARARSQRAERARLKDAKGREAQS
jgi:hypothetical protein